MNEKPTVIFVDGLPKWNDGSGEIHNPTQWRSPLAASHLPVDPIVVRQVPAAFSFDSKNYPSGSYVQLVGGRAVKAYTPEEFAAEWQVTGTARG